MTEPEVGEEGDIRLRSIAVPVEEDPTQEDESKLISRQDATSSESEEAKYFPRVYQLECGNTHCEFEFALYEFVWKPETTFAPPRPPSSSSESESSEEEERDGEKEALEDEGSEKRPAKVLNTEANVTVEEGK